MTSLFSSSSSNKNNNVETLDMNFTSGKSDITTSSVNKKHKYVEALDANDDDEYDEQTNKNIINDLTIDSNNNYKGTKEFIKKYFKIQYDTFVLEADVDYENNIKQNANYNKLKYNSVDIYFNKKLLRMLENMKKLENELIIKKIKKYLATL
jgi:hypothetical protein